MKGLQNIFQVLIKPGFLILFLFGFLGSNCGRIKEGSAPQNTEKGTSEQGATGETLEEQLRQLAADERELAAMRKEWEEIRQSGDATKLAEMEKKLKEMESKYQQQQKQVVCLTLDGHKKCVANLDTSQEKLREEAMEAVTCMMSELNEFQNVFQEDQLTTFFG